MRELIRAPGLGGHRKEFGLYPKYNGNPLESLQWGYLNYIFKMIILAAMWKNLRIQGEETQTQLGSCSSI